MPRDMDGKGRGFNDWRTFLYRQVSKSCCLWSVGKEMKAGLVTKAQRDLKKFLTLLYPKDQKHIREYAHALLVEKYTW
jgi:hypothetical protein